jgi:hypothetical protein
MYETNVHKILVGKLPGGLPHGKTKHRKVDKTWMCSVSYVDKLFFTTDMLFQTNINDLLN